MKTFTFQHFLFGHDRGHSLIAGSEILSHRLEGMLAKHSEAVPGFSLERSEQYWSGLPIGKTEYALISTWPAPEMPCPGCVWSHVVIVPYGELSEIPDLNLLRSCFRKPTSQGDLQFYRVPLRLESQLGNMYKRAPKETLLVVLKAVYGPSSSGILGGNYIDGDTATFDLWSQQWPELRHKFRFSTVIQSKHALEISSKSWLRFSDLVFSEYPKTEDLSWLAELCLGMAPKSRLRQLMQIAGPELPSEPASVRMLAQIFAYMRVTQNDRELRALKLAAKKLPSPSEGRRLKSWLISSILSSGSKGQSFNLLEFLLTDDSSIAFKELDISILTGLSDIWRDDPSGVIQLIDQSSENPTVNFQDVVGKLAKSAPADALACLGDDEAWRGRVLLAKSRPELVRYMNIKGIPTQELVELTCITESDVCDRLVLEVLERPRKKLCLKLDKNFRSLIIAAIVSTARKQKLEQSIHSDWSKPVKKLSSDIVLQAVRTLGATSSLYNVLEFLSWPAPRANKVSSEEWLRFIEVAEEDQRVESRKRFYAYILSVAFKDPRVSSIRLFEHVVPQIMDWLGADSLDQDVEKLVMSNVGFYLSSPKWDKCSRLRRALQDYYADNFFKDADWRRLGLV